MHARSFPLGWSALAVIVLGGSLLTTLVATPSLTISQIAVVWIPSLLLIGLGFWFRFRFSKAPDDLRPIDRLTGGAWLLLILLGIDATILYGGSAWRPLTIAGGFVFLLVGACQRWERIPSHPYRQRDLRRLGYFGLTSLGLGLAFWIEPYSAMLFFLSAELLAPRTEFARP